MQQLADREQVLGVLAYWADNGCSLRQALARQHVPETAFWARVRRGEPDVKAAFETLRGQWAFVAMDEVLDESARHARAGSAAWGTIWQRQTAKMAEALAPLTWATAGQAAAVGALSRDDAVARLRELLGAAQQRAQLAGGTVEPSREQNSGDIVLER